MAAKPFVLIFIISLSMDGISWFLIHIDGKLYKSVSIMEINMCGMKLYSTVGILSNGQNLFLKTANLF